MQKILIQIEKTSLKQLHIWIVFIGSLVASQVQYIQHGWINPDSVLYLEAAKFFSKGEWVTGLEVYNWPIYSLCIALVNQITHLGVHISAQILNVIFFAIATYSFIAIIKLAGGKQKQIVAGALIWLSAQYMIGGVLEMLMRDEGFWAFYLLSLVFFIQYYQQHRFKDALLWQVCIIIAILFRIEAMLYLLFLPLVLLSHTEFTLKQKWKSLVIANAINICLAIIVIAVLSLNDSFSTKLLGRLNEVFTTNLWQQLTGNLSQKSLIMSEQVLGKYLEEFATTGLLLTFLYVIFAKIINSTGLIVVGLGTIAIKNYKHFFNQQAFQVLSVAAVIATINMGLIITKVFVLSGRYVLAFSFIFMVFAAFYFAEILFKKTPANKTNWIALALVLFMLGGALKNILPKKQGYNFRQDAVAWVVADNVENKPVFYDQVRMRYYAGAAFIGTFGDPLTYLKTMIANKSVSNHDYVVVESSTKDNQVKILLKKNLPDYILMKQFNNVSAKKSILVYVKKESNV